MTAVHRSLLAVVLVGLVLLVVPDVGAVPFSCGQNDIVRCGLVVESDFVDWRDALGPACLGVGCGIPSPRDVFSDQLERVTIDDSIHEFRRQDQSSSVFEPYSGTFRKGDALLVVGSFQVAGPLVIDFENPVMGAGFHIVKNPSIFQAKEFFSATIKAFDETDLELTPPGGFVLTGPDVFACSAPADPLNCPFGSAPFLGVGSIDKTPIISRIEVDVFTSGVQVTGFAVDKLRIGVVPEPATLLLVGVGMIGVAARRRR